MATMESEPTGAAAAAPAGSEAVDAALTKIAEENVQMEVVQGAVVLLGKVLANIVATPEEAKFRALKKANKQVAGKILPCRGALALMISVGFRSADEVLTLADERLDVEKLQYAIVALSGVEPAKLSFDAAKKGAVLAERQAQVAAETNAINAKRQALKAAEAGDKEARKDPNWKAKAFEKGGKDPGRVPGVYKQQSPPQLGSQGYL